MRHVIKIFLVIFVLYLSLGVNVSKAALKGGLEYKIPIDYSQISREELETKGAVYYKLATKNSNGEITDDITDALNIYTILHMQNPDNVFYCARLGHLYDVIDKDRYAKGFLTKATQIAPNDPEPHFRLGEYYYKRDKLKKALQNYKEAYVLGYDDHYETLYQIGDIYAKFGDTEAALKYFKLASELSPNESLDKRIVDVENENAVNKEFYTDTRIRLIER